VVVLDEAIPNAGFFVPALVVGLEKQAAIVAMNLRFEQQNAVELGGTNPQLQGSRSRSASRSPSNGTRTWVISSRERMVAAWSFSVSKSTVTA
jgi:hypothetical protein